MSLIPSISVTFTVILSVRNHYCCCSCTATGSGWLRSHCWGSLHCWPHRRWSLHWWRWVGRCCCCFFLLLTLWGRGATACTGGLTIGVTFSTIWATKAASFPPYSSANRAVFNALLLNMVCIFLLIKANLKVLLSSFSTFFGIL